MKSSKVHHNRFVKGTLLPCMVYVVKREDISDGLDMVYRSSGQSILVSPLDYFLALPFTRQSGTMALMQHESGFPSGLLGYKTCDWYQLTDDD